MAPKNKPCIEVETGSQLVFEAYDCFEKQIDSEDVVFQELDWNRINPATEPVLELSKDGATLFFYPAICRQ